MLVHNLKLPEPNLSDTQQTDAGRTDGSRQGEAHGGPEMKAMDEGRGRDFRSCIHGQNLDALPDEGNS